MGTIQPKWIGIPDADARQGFIVQWGPMGVNDIAVPIDMTSVVVDHADRSVQVEGAFGVGGNVAIVGSIDAVNFEVLNDPSSSPLNFAQGKVRGILEVVRSIGPQVTAGDGTTSVTISIIMRKLK